METLESLYKTCLHFHQIQKNLLQQHEIINDQEKCSRSSVNTNTNIEETTNKELKTKEIINTESNR